MTSVFFCDTENEKLEYMKDLENNLDFTYLGHFDSIQDIYHELNYQGFTDSEIKQMTKNRYGNCLDIIEYVSYYDAFIGAR